MWMESSMVSRRIQAVNSRRPWRVAVLGLGHWYSAFGLARSLREYSKAELVAASWDNKAQLDAFTSTFGVKGYSSYDELLDREEVDIVHLAPPVSHLEALTIRCARAAKHIILGKPMAMSVAQADRMIEAVESAGVSCLPFQGIMRLRGADLKARIDHGEIGELVLMHQASRWSIAEDWYNSGTPGWFADPSHVPGGAFIDEGIYWIDFFRWMS
jgi:predicted dehydrogenase